MHASREPGDFSLNSELSSITRSITLAKIGVIDGGCPGTVEEKDRSFFESLSVDQFHTDFCEDKPDLMLGPHGVSCASVICGSRRFVNFFDVCQNYIQGVVPGAPLHAYAVGCGTRECNLYDECIENAIKRATEDGVKVLSYSMGPTAEDMRKFCKRAEDYSIGLALLDASKKVLVCVAAGNDGPEEKSVVAGMPWVMSVGACTNGQILETTVKIAKFEEGSLSTIATFQGVSLNVIESPFLKLRVHKEAWGKEEAVLQARMKHETCYLWQAEPYHNSNVVSPNASGVPMAIISEVQIYELHQLHKKHKGRLFVKILASKYQEDKRNVLVTNFSARGPSILYPDTVAPDVVALGYAVLMSHPSNIPHGYINTYPTDRELEEMEYNNEFEETENDDILFNIDDNEVKQVEPLYSNCVIDSGTSFACPQVAAYALIVYSFHPEWSPYAVKSALITTALSFAARDIPGDEFTFGAGSIDVKSALNPGLVYDESWEHFRQHARKDRTIFDLNLPTFAASFPYSQETCEQIFERQLTNVSERDVEYTFSVKYFKRTLDRNVYIEAIPSSLKFEPGETKKFKLLVRIVPRSSEGAHISGMVQWLPSKKSTGGHPVCSPIHLYHETEFES